MAYPVGVKRDKCPEYWVEGANGAELASALPVVPLRKAQKCSEAQGSSLLIF